MNPLPAEYGGAQAATATPAKPNRRLARLLRHVCFPTAAPTRAAAGASSSNSSSDDDAPLLDICANPAQPRGWHRTRGEVDRELRIEFKTAEGSGEPQHPTPLMNEQAVGLWSPKASTAELLPLWPAGRVPLARGPADGEDPEAFLPLHEGGEVLDLGSDADRAKLEELNPNRAAFVANFGSAHTWKGAHVPALQVFAPPPGVAATGAACVVAPGGGYGFLAPHEGMAVAAWLASHGVTAFVLRYRLLPYQYPAPLLDMQRAVRYIRHHKVSTRSEQAKPPRYLG